jgi:magnesium transporter
VIRYRFITDKGCEIINSVNETDIKNYCDKGFLWVHLEEATFEDWATIGKNFDLHNLSIEDAQKKGQRSKLDIFPTYLFVSIRLLKLIDNQIEYPELGIFVSRNFIITSHVECDTIIKHLENQVEFTNYPILSPAQLLYEILDRLVDDMFPLVDDLDDRITLLEEQVYEEFDRSIEVPLTQALKIKKDLLIIRQTLAPIREVLNELLRERFKNIPAELVPFFMDVYDHALRVIEQIDLHRDLLGGVMDAIVAQNGNRLNNVMKTLTVISTALMSSTLVAGIYGMNFKYMPELEWRFGYPLALFLMIGFALLGMLLFRVKKWI